MKCANRHASIRKEIESAEERFPVPWIWKRLAENVSDIRRLVCAQSAARGQSLLPSGRIAFGKFRKIRQLAFCRCNEFLKSGNLVFWSMPNRDLQSTRPI